MGSFIRTDFEQKREEKRWFTFQAHMSRIKVMLVGLILRVFRILNNRTLLIRDDKEKDQRFAVQLLCRVSSRPSLCLFTT